jgi:hypothetical protein
MAKITAPTKLGAKARRLWNEITDNYELRADELRILEDACREVDLIERLEAAVADGDLIVDGSMKQPVANPLVQELRQHRQTLRSLLASVNLPDDDADAPASSRSTSAREAAAARWRRGA